MSEETQSLADMIEDGIKGRLRMANTVDGDAKPVLTSGELLKLLDTAIKWESVKRKQGAEDGDGYGSALRGGDE